MSRAYRVSVRETIRRVVRAEDHVRSQLELLEVLPASEMAELLAGELARRGFARQGETLTRTQDGVEVSVELATGAVTVRAAAEKEVELEGEQTGHAYEEAANRREVETRLSEQLRTSLEREAREREAKLQSELTGRLEAQLGDISAELDHAVNRATAEALKRKAAQIGRIKEMTEDPEAGGVTIVVEL